MVRALSRRLFVATILTGSFLLFLIQPMVARMALPRLGGAPQRLEQRYAGLSGAAAGGILVRAPIVAHAAEAPIAAALDPLCRGSGNCRLRWSICRARPPEPRCSAPALLALSIGPVFFLVSAQVWLMQRWYALHPEAGSHGRSMLIEPGQFRRADCLPTAGRATATIRAQAWVWSAGYLVLLGLIALCARARRGLPEAALVQAAVSTDRSRHGEWHCGSCWRPCLRG